VPQFTLITQNVDGLHQRAGSRQVIELHGNITRVKCSDDGQVVESWREEAEVPPRCPRCGGMLRPDVVWFGEMLPAGALEASEAAARSCDVFLSVGTSGWSIRQRDCRSVHWLTAHA
jgi:NAD-dependent deacetylase